MEGGCKVEVSVYKEGVGRRLLEYWAFTRWFTEGLLVLRAYLRHYADMKQDVSRCLGRSRSVGGKRAM